MLKPEPRELRACIRCLPPTGSFPAHWVLCDGLALDPLLHPAGRAEAPALPLQARLKTRTSQASRGSNPNPTGKPRLKPEPQGRCRLYPGSRGTYEQGPGTHGTTDLTALTSTSMSDLRTPRRKAASRSGGRSDTLRRHYRYSNDGLCRHVCVVVVVAACPAAAPALRWLEQQQP